jgi:transcriptional adapter 2-alpha
MQNITGMPRIKCADCENFDLCMNCFAAGNEVAPHKNSHAYRVVDNIAFPLFHKDWTAEEELLLLEGIETYGVGNWRDVSDHVGSKDKTTCENHYINTYLKSQNKPLPVLLGKDGSNQADEGAEDDTEPGAVMTCDQKNSSSSELDSLPNIKKHNDLAGFMPLRGDFDVEHDNDAELILADMEFLPDDHPSETELKLKIIEIYNSKLDERARRKKFVLERNLLDYKKHQAVERRRPKDERELVTSMRCFSRFHSAEQHERFVEGELDVGCGWVGKPIDSEICV